MQLIKHISYFIFTNKSLCMNLLFRLLVVVMLLFSADALLAQSRRVTGTITDANGPVTGASVLIKGTTKGVATDIDGNFALDVEGADPILVISGVGYTAQEVAVGTQSAIALILEEDVTVFSDVVVTGYSVETKRETTGAVSTIKAKDLKAIPSGNVEQQLQGRVSGVTVVSLAQVVSYAYVVSMPSVVMSHCISWMVCLWNLRIS
jgi:hypothetical protein